MELQSVFDDNGWYPLIKCSSTNTKSSFSLVAYSLWRQIRPSASTIQRALWCRKRASIENNRYKPQHVLGALQQSAWFISARLASKWCVLSFLDHLYGSTLLDSVTSSLLFNALTHTSSFIHTYGFSRTITVSDTSGLIPGFIDGPIAWHDSYQWMQAYSYHVSSPNERRLHFGCHLSIP